MKDRCQHKGTEPCYTSDLTVFNMLTTIDAPKHNKCCHYYLSLMSATLHRVVFPDPVATLKVLLSMESELSSHRCTVGITDIHYATCFISRYPPHQIIALHAKLYKTRFHIDTSIICAQSTVKTHLTALYDTKH